MNGRHPRTPASSPASRTQGALIHRGPGAIAATHSLTAPPFVHAPNAALLIDFDNVTMGIRSDLGKELRTLLSSDIIKGKVAVQRAYADWRRYPQYIVPLSESSIDLLVQNCDEYYSYNALAGLMKASEDEPARKFDPWELVTEAITRMKRNGDVMRSDRLKQVMQDIDPAFDEKNLGMSKFSRFVQEAHQRGLLSMTKLENGQLEIGPPLTAAAPESRAALPALEPVELQRPAAPVDGAVREREAGEQAEEREERGRRGRRGRGRGRGRDREDRPRPAAPAAPAATTDLLAPLR